MLETLQIIARTLPDIPDETVHYQLLTFDSILSISPGLRLDAARLLEQAAGNCTEESRRERLRDAALRVAAGDPSAQVFGVETPQNQTMTLAEWQEQEALEREAALRTEPPPLPQFAASDLFPGLTVRLADGALAHVKTIDPLTFDEPAPAPAPVSGALFEPVPDLRTLVSTVRAIDQQWTRVKKPRSPHLPRIQSEFDTCRAWVRGGEQRGDAPVCFSGPLARKVFPDTGETARLGFRIEFLFTAALHYTRLNSNQENS